MQTLQMRGAKSPPGLLLSRLSRRRQPRIKGADRRPAMLHVRRETTHGASFLLCGLPSKL